MTSNLPRPSSSYSYHAEGSASTRELTKPISPCGPKMGGPALAQNTYQVVPQSPPPWRSSSDVRSGLGIREIIESPHTEFLALAIQCLLPDSLVDDVLAGYRASTVCQYQSSWMRFKSFLKNNKTAIITKSTPFQFEAWFFHRQDRACAAI